MESINGGEGVVRRFARKVIVPLIAVCVMAVSSEGWAQPAIYWSSAPDPRAVGGCFGNCGADCSGRIWGGFPAPCGGSHYWTLNILTTPQRTGQQELTNECYGGHIWVAHWDEYLAWARWTFHGVRSWGCEWHDSICRDQNDWSCFGTALLFAGGEAAFCVDASSKTWAYETSVAGLTQTPVSYDRTFQRCVAPPL